MRFRVRNYDEEEAACSLPGQVVYQHPLSSAQLQRMLGSASPFEASVTEEYVEYTILDPLRALLVQDSLLAISTPGTMVGRSSYDQSTSKAKLDDQTEAAAAEWELHRASILQRFASSDTIRVSKTLDVISSHLKGRAKSSTVSHLEKVDEHGEESEQDVEMISQEEYVRRLRGLNSDIAHTWRNNERVATLRLAVKVAKLLLDTSIPKFYPTLFILVTDVLDTIGTFVWRRIKGKAELNDNGELKNPLPDFTANDVCEEAKDICNNWFYKVGSIHELLPRIYLEVAILHCTRFLQKDPPMLEFQRLNMMMRGVADPLAAAYARLYFARRGQIIMPHETGYLVTGLDDYLLLYRRVLSGDFDRIIFKSGLDNHLYASLVEPVFEFYVRYICAHATKDELLFILRTFCWHETASMENGEDLIPVSVMVHFLVKELPATLVCTQALELSQIIKRAVDISKPQYLNYRLLGTKLCECNPARELCLTILNDIWKVVMKYCDLVEYLTVADVFIDYIIQRCSEVELRVLLQDIRKHLKKATITEEGLRLLESIVLKIVAKVADINHVLTLPFFVDIIDIFFGDPRNSLYKQILIHISRKCQVIQDPVTRHFVFELCKYLYKSLDSMSSEDDRRQVVRLISRFVQLVDFGSDYKEHLSFLVDCRGTFADMDPLKETLVHISNRLAVVTLKTARGVVTECSVNFVKGCVTFNEITIPSMRSVVKCFHLYVETAEVALMNGLVFHSENILKSAITCLQECQDKEDPRNAGMEMQMLDCIKKLCSFLIVIPGHPDHGPFDLVRGLLQVINKGSCLSESTEVQALLGVVLACCALSQESLPYHALPVEVISNDKLFNRELRYLEELVHLTVEVVNCITMRSLKAGVDGTHLLFACEVLATALEYDGSDNNDDNEDEFCRCITSFAKVAGPHLLSKHGKHSSFVNYFLKKAESASLRGMMKPAHERQH